MPSSKTIKDNAFHTYLEEVKAVLKDDGFPQDNVGNTKLTLLAHKIKNPLPNVDYKGYVSAIQQCAELIPSLSLIEIKNLCNLIQLSEIPDADYHEKYLEAFKRWEKKKTNMEGRAEVFRLICESGADVNPFFVNSENEIKKSFPWYWIDAAVVPAWDDAINETKKQLEEKKDIKPLLLRLPRWWNSKKDKSDFFKALSELVPTINNDNIQKVRNYLELIGISEDKINDIVRNYMPPKNLEFIKNIHKRYTTMHIAYAC